MDGGSGRRELGGYETIPIISRNLQIVFSKKCSDVLKFENQLAGRLLKKDSLLG